MNDTAVASGDTSYVTAPFFSRARHRFMPLPADERIEVKPFLAAARELLDVLDFFGRFLKPVKTDIHGNITTLQNKYDTNPEKFKTFNDVLEQEHEAGTSDGYVALLWLKRALDFLASFVTLLVVDHMNGVRTESLSSLSHKAYEQSLQPYHNFVVRNFSRLLLRLVPSRSTLNKHLCGSDVLPEMAMLDMDESIRLLSANLQVINQLFPEEERI